LLGGVFTKLEESIMGNSPIVSRINGLLAEKGISKRDFYRDCGITSASYSLWNTGKTTPRMKNLEVIANYLETTTDYLLTGLGEKEKAPTQEGEREIDDRQMKAAFLGGLANGLSDEEIDEYWDDARDYIGFKIQQKKNRSN
jgi:transcriptional regulator with XRE-family HTH domain